MNFSDSNAGYDYSVPSSPDATFGVADSNDAHLENFFSRPIKIASYNWAVGANLFESFDPWTLFFTNPRVLNRIANYNLLRCRLCVKVVLNGNGFHYGRAIMSYNPLHTMDTLTKDRAFFNIDIVEASQRPHIYLNPTTSSGGTMCLPFIYPLNAISIPQEKWSEMGECTIHGMQSLKHANGASDSVTVSVFAWAEDVSLSAPTSAEPASMVPQAGVYTPQADEYGTGIVSMPASFIARAAGALADAPMIGLYAKATQLAASTVATIAKTFGFSRPNDISAIVPYKPTVVGNIANTNMPDSAIKLTLDAKQELSCDTRTFGLDGTDEMTIKSIATRESYFTSFSWLISKTAEECLFSIRNCPSISRSQTISTVLERHLPACAFVTMPFKYWRGTMKYRFQIVCSQFHKGRLKVVYDPAGPVTNEYNTAYTRIIDIAEEKDFTVEIGWGQPTTFLENPGFDFTPFSTAPLSAMEGANGVLSVYVVNELTVPNSIADNNIEVNVFVSAGDDFEVVEPTEEFIRQLSWYMPQSGVYTPQAGEDPDAHETSEENAPLQETIDESMAPTLSDSDNTFDVFFGDPVVSIRQLLKRYCLSRVWGVNANGTDTYMMCNIQTSNLPPPRGYAPGALDIAAGPASYNYTKMTHLGWFLPAFACWRGGIRWKYHLVNHSTNNKAFMSVVRNPNPSGGAGVNAIGLDDNGSSTSIQSAQFAGLLPSYLSGGHMTDVSVNPVVEVELPFYSNQRFYRGKQGNVFLNPGKDSGIHNVYYMANAAATGDTFVYASVSTGEDFTLGMFTGAPVAYAYNDPVPA